MVSICTYPRCSTAAATACGPSPKGIRLSSRWARSQMRLAAALVRGWSFCARDIVRQCRRIRGYLKPEISSAFRPLPDASRRDVGRARGFTVFGGLAFVDVAGEPVDEPQILVVRALHASKPGADSRNQRGQQNRGGDQG